MADWLLIPKDFQSEIYNHLRKHIHRVLEALPLHNSENVVTGALGETLRVNPLDTENDAALARRGVARVVKRYPAR